MNRIDDLIDNDGCWYVWMPPCDRSIADKRFKVVVGTQNKVTGQGFIRIRGDDGDSGTLLLSVDELTALAVACMQAVRGIKSRKEE